MMFHVDGDFKHKLQSMLGQTKGTVSHEPSVVTQTLRLLAIEHSWHREVRCYCARSYYQFIFQLAHFLGTPFSAFLRVSLVSCTLESPAFSIYDGC